MSNARTRYYFLDMENALLHALLTYKEGMDRELMFLGESDAKPVIIAPLFLRNIMQDPDDFILQIQQEPTIQPTPSIDHGSPEAESKQDP